MSFMLLVLNLSKRLTKSLGKDGMINCHVHEFSTRMKLLKLYTNTDENAAKT